MIIWFQKTFGKHYKWALIVALSVLCLSTIVGIGAVPRGALSGGSNTQIMYLGIDLNNQQENQEVNNAVMFTNESLSDNPSSSQQELQLLRDERLALRQLADQWQIPEATPKEMEDYLRGLNIFQDAQGNFSPVAYSSFRDSINAAEPAKRDIALATIKENCRLERVREILGGPGYVLPYMAIATEGVSKLKLDLEAATLDFAKFEPTVTDVKDGDLQSIFEKNADSFKKAAQARLSFAKFPAATIGDPTPAQLHDYVVAHKDTYPNPDKLSDKDKTAATEAWRTEQKAQAEKDAGDAAMKFSRELFDLKAAPNSPEFAALLKKYNLTLASLPLLEQGKPAPAASPIPDDILQQVAFGGLSAQQPFAPVQLADGAAVIFLDEAIPARAQTFAEAKDQVKTAYLEQQKEAQFISHGQVARDAITKAMAEGKSFAEAAAAQGLTVKSFSGITYEGIQDTVMGMSLDANDKSTAGGPLAAMGKDLLMALGSPTANSGPPLLMTMQANEVSPFVPSTESGAIFHVTNRVIPPVDPNTPEVKRLEEAFSTRESNQGAMLYLQRVIQSARDALKQAQSNQG